MRLRKPKAPKILKKKHILKRTLPLFGPYRWQLLLSMLFVSITGLCYSSMPMFTKHVVDVSIPNRDFGDALIVMIGFVGLMIVRMASWYAGQCFLLMIREQIIFSLRSSVFAQMQELCLRFHNRYSPGYLYDRTLGGASTSVGMFLSMFFNNIVTYGVVLSFSVFFCIALSPVMTAILFTMSLSYVFAAKHFRKQIHKVTKAFNLESNEFAGMLTDLLRGVKTIKAFAMEQRVVEDFNSRLWPLQMKSLDVNKETMRLNFVSEGLGYFISTAVILLGSYMVIYHKMPLGTLVAFVSYQGMITGMLMQLSTVAGTYGSAIAGLEQIYEVLDEEPTVVESPNAVAPESPKGRITFEHVYFSYEEDKPVVSGMSVDIPPGQSVALVGPSGGGKSTFANLLLRLYDPDSGVIKLDGKDICELSLTDYRSLFGVVLQEPFLFNETIYDNLQAVKPDATDEEMRDALTRAQAWEFVENLSGGWHFKVGEGGSQLSGGQRQRIALARCILTDPKIMVLDEATSALDNQSEALVQTALEEMMHKRTVIVIAHRLSTVRNVDRILVLQKGRIVQDGTFDQLCREPGVFRDLHMLTLRGTEPAGEEC